MRQKTGEDILQGMLYSLKHTINDVVSKEKQLHIDTLLCYNWVVNEINKQQPLSAEN
jgi:HD superfamily phosphohydrolase YqeK